MGLTKPRAAQIYNLDYKQATRVVTVSNVTLSGGAPNSVDGVTLSLHDRILVTGQSTGSQNGLYYVTSLGTGSNGTWVRTSDSNETGEIEAGMIIMVTEGSTYADTQWKLITNDPITIGSTALTFTQNYSANSISGGTSNVVVYSNANVTISSAGTPNVLTISSTGAVISGTGSVTGNITGGNLTTVGTANVGTLNVTGLTTLNGNTTINGHVLPTVDIAYDLGSPTQRWRSLYVSANTIDIGGATISADLVTGSLILTGPDGAEFILTGSSATTSEGAFGYLLVGSNAAANSTTTGAVQVTGGIGLTGNLFAGGIIDVAGNSIYLGNLVLKDDGSNIFGLYAADGVTPATISQSSVDTTRISNGTSNVQVVASNGNVTVGVGGTSNVVVVSSVGANISGTLGTTGNVTGGNVLTAGSVSATGNVTGGNITTAGQVSASGNITGNYLLANITFASGYNTTRLFNGTSEANIGEPGGNANISIGGTSNVVVFANTGVYVSGIQSVTGNISTSNSISVGGDIAVTSSITANGSIIANSNLFANAIVSAAGNVIGGNISTTGNVTGGNILGDGSHLSGITAFNNIVISGGTQSNVVAGSIGSTLTLAAASGSGFVWTTDAANNTITLNTGGGGTSIFADGGDMGLVTEVVTSSEDLGLVTDLATIFYDLGSVIAASGLIYPSQLILPAYTPGTLPSASPAAQFIYLSTSSVGPMTAFSDGTNWRFTSSGNVVS